MKTFKDNKGREWVIDANVASLSRVRDLCKVDVFDLAGKDDMLKRLLRDPILLCNVIYAMCRPEANEKGISDEDFGRAMAGDAIDYATTALLEEIVNFSPNERDRRILDRVLKTTMKTREKGRDMVEAQINAGVLEKTAQRALDLAGKSLINLPESLELPPDLSPSDN